MEMFEGMDEIKSLNRITSQNRRDCNRHERGVVISIVQVDGGDFANDPDSQWSVRAIAKITTSIIGTASLTTPRKTVRRKHSDSEYSVGGIGIVDHVVDTISNTLIKI